MTARDKAILIGLYLSKFDKIGLQILGFEGFVEAYNVLGLSLGIKPASIKNYRDEFDPVFPNDRKGRRNRPIREYCKTVLDQYSNLNLESFHRLIRSFVSKDFEIEEIVQKGKNRDYSDSVAKRLVTGKAAEEYFKSNYQNISLFESFNLKDTTNLGCGFDYKLSNESNFYCVEVKGLSGTSGSISLTEKEYDMAQTYCDHYCLFVVMNFTEKPFHSYFFDPLKSRLSFKKVERQTVITNYTSLI